MAYDSRNPKKSSLILTDEAGTPANPPAGSTKLITRSGLLYHRSSAGAETAVLTGAAATQYSGKSADYTVTDTDNIRTVGMTTGASARTVTLPTAADNTHRIITVKKVDNGAGTCTVDGEGSETIDGATTLVLTSQYDGVTIQCDGTNWKILDRGLAATSTESGIVSLASQVFAGRKSGTNSKCGVRRASSQTITTGTTTKIQFDTEDVDSNGEFDNATNYRFVGSRAGYYLATCYVNFGALGDAKTGVVYLRKNNSGTGEYLASDLTGVSAGVCLSVTGVFQLNGSTDYIEAFVEHNKGSDATIAGGTNGCRMFITELF